MSAQPELFSGPQTQVPADLEALFNTNDYVDLSALDVSVTNTPTANLGNTHPSGSGSGSGSGPMLPASSGSGFTPRSSGEANYMADFDINSAGGGNMTFDFGNNGAGFGGEMLAGEGMDTVSDGLRGSDPNQGLSAATILSLLEEGSFDYSSIFTDQAS